MNSGIIFDMKQNTAVVMTADGEFLSIPARMGWNIGDKITLSEFELKSNAMKQKNKTKTMDMKKYYKAAIITIVASLLFFIIPFSITTEAKTIVTLDINPSFELELENNEVSDIRALNPDGDKVLQNLDSSQIQGSLYQVTSNILDKVHELGYISEVDEPFIMVGVMSKDKTFETEKYEQFISEKLMEKSLNSDVLMLNANKKKDKTIADKKGISLGKYLLQDKEKKEGIIITDEQLKKNSVKEIIKDIKDKKEKKQKKENGNKDNNVQDTNKDKDKNSVTTSNNNNQGTSSKTEDNNNNESFKKDRTEDQKNSRLIKSNSAEKNTKKDNGSTYK